MGKSSPSGTLSSELSWKKRLPECVESHLRKLWKDTHGFNMIGSWLCNEEVMSAIYFAWIDTPKALHIPDLASVTKRSTLTQRSVQGTLISGGSVEQVEYILDPCTTHPDFFMRIRAYLMLICWLVIETPTWFCFETALTTVDLSLRR